MLMQAFSTHPARFHHRQPQLKKRPTAVCILINQKQLVPYSWNLKGKNMIHEVKSFNFFKDGKISRKLSAEEKVDHIYSWHFSSYHSLLENSAMQYRYEASNILLP